jgi:two-component system, response regulator FlrC
MRVLIIGSLAGELGQAARMAIARGAKLDQADDAEAGLVRLRGDARVDVVLCDLRHDVGALVATMAAERITTPVVACGVTPDAEAAVRAMRQGAREFLPLPPDPELIAAILEAA